MCRCYNFCLLRRVRRAHYELHVLHVSFSNNWILSIKDTNNEYTVEYVSGVQKSNHLSLLNSDTYKFSLELYGRIQSVSHAGSRTYILQNGSELRDVIPCQSSGFEALYTLL